MTTAPRNNIVLVGFMGTGKSAVGRLLARALYFRFLDMDRTIEQRTGRRISELFAVEGEAYFRRLECDLAAELSKTEKMVISTGGGIVLNPENIEQLSRSGLVVCLQASADTILSRVEHSRHRPLIEEGDKRQKIEALLEKRRPLYDAIPDRVETDGLTLEQVRDRVLDVYRAKSRTEPRIE